MLLSPVGISLGGSRVRISREAGRPAGETRLTFHTAEDSLPTWSPDGTVIAFSSRRQNPAADVNLLEPFGNVFANLTNSPGEESWPTWSPDGTQIGFHGRLDDPPARSSTRINVDGTGACV